MGTEERFRALAGDLTHLTPLGKCEVIWYAIRRRFITPAPDSDRCIMGYPIGPHIRCPRRCVDDSLWCKRHADV